MEWVLTKHIVISEVRILRVFSSRKHNKPENYVFKTVNRWHSIYEIQNIKEEFPETDDEITLPFKTMLPKLRGKL